MKLHSKYAPFISIELSSPKSRRLQNLGEDNEEEFENMYIVRVVKHLLTFAVVLFIASCNQSPEQPLATSTSEDVNGSVVAPVIVETIQDADQTYLQFHCLGLQGCYESILLPANTELLYQAKLDQNDNLLIPIRTKNENEVNSIGFIQVSKTSQKFVTALLPGFRWFDYIEQTIIFENKMIFTISGDDHLYILNESGKIKEISFTDMDSGTSHYRIVKGGTEEIIVVGQSLKKQNNRNLIDVSVIDLRNNTVETELILWPESVEFEALSTPAPGMKYNAQIDGITSDKRMLYYQYFGYSDSMRMTKQLSTYNTLTQNDRNYQDMEGCIGTAFFKEYKGYLYKNGVKNDMVSEAPLILDISNFESILDFKKIETNSTIVRIVPFGNSFLVGFDNKIIQIDFSGDILQEFPVPHDTVGGDYIIAQFEN